MNHQRRSSRSLGKRRGKKGKKREETGVDMVRDDETHGV